jgi:putative tryptophan/tyrosine transport system substrate-binding protein
VIVTSGVAATRAVKTATTSIPIVFSVGGDPVQLGFVASLNRPGSSSLTGVTSLSTDLGPKRLELLHEIIPAARTIAVLVNPAGVIAESQLKDLQTAAQTLGLRLHILHAVADGDFEMVFSNLIQSRAGGLVIAGDPLLNRNSEQLAALAVRHGVPAIGLYPEFAAAGGLMSYVTNIVDQYRVVGRYVGRILKRERAGDLPVQQSTKVELIINMKAAKMLGITIPLAILGRADEVIE